MRRGDAINTDNEKRKIHLRLRSCTVQGLQRPRTRGNFFLEGPKICNYMIDPAKEGS